MSDSSNLGSGWPTETQRLLVPAAVVPDPALHQTLVWDRIDALEREVLTLKSYHNTLALPSRLPPEVLCDIFLAAGVVPERSDQARRVAWNDSGERLWIVVTHVCKSWRETALGCPALWANLTFISPSFTRVMLQRSRNAPLTIDYSGKFQHEDLLAEAISHTERLRSVKIGIPNNTSLRFEYALSGFSSGVEATILETLSLESVSRNGLLPARFLHGGAPSLKLLSLKGCHIPDWKALPLGPNLTTLTILPCKAVANTTKYRPSALDFYRSLNRILQLQSLDLRGFLPLDTCVLGNSSIISRFLKPRYLNWNLFTLAWLENTTS
ncbi:hypothetical protein DFP72DRAFT_435379 [Ephemerocybe angulata]|uniref:F-box domain-containing protein n=1 Tax=Ephemerocybe angulata TaxID=980116 RepID=A0A8H6HVB4_9AGAR|nr:hypothetical protein DFP72DRAFT_435379 [Tulosesus angulatus]